MPTATADVTEQQDYKELLKNARKTITVALQAQSGTPDEIRENNENALRAVGWKGEPYTITPAKVNYSYYGRNNLSPAQAKYERPYTAAEIKEAGPRLYAAHQKALRRAAQQRAKNITKLRALQRKLDLPLYEGD